MARVKRGVTAGRRHKKVLGKAKGYYNARRKVYRAEHSLLGRTVVLKVLGRARRPHS